MKCPKCQTTNPDDSRFCNHCASPLQPDDIPFIHTRTILVSEKSLKEGSPIAGRYKIIEELGRGGMGIVYKAEDTKLKRAVALKFLPEELMRDPESKERFVREAQSAAALDHPNICTVHEIDEAEGKTFISMAFVAGQSLKQKIKSGPLSLEETLHIAIQMAEGLEEAHDKGIVHRDIKSANVMVTEKGQAKIMDFGLAKISGDTLVTRAGTTLGTVAYMSPEQAQGREVSTRSDIWSMGIVLYEMLSGQLPFKGEIETAVMYSIVHEDPRPLRDIQPDLPVTIQKVIERALAKKPESRYESAADMMEDLKRIQKTEGVAGVETLEFRSVWRRLRRPQIAIPAVAIFIALSLLFVWFIRRSTKVQWARKTAIPEIIRLAEAGDWMEAYTLAKEAEKYISDDPMLIDLWPKFSRDLSFTTEPPGAKVFLTDYAKEDGGWVYLGNTPVENLKIPQGYSKFKLEKEGYRNVFIAHSGYTLIDKVFRMHKKGDIPDRMVWVPGGEYSLSIPGLDHLDEVQLDEYLIDKYEVTNKEFKFFMDSGGYENKEYWKFPFVKEEKVLSWEQAMALFRDKTGRPGPATWEVGDYPEGQDDYPVSGISWYEAAAYAEFTGKSLPTIYHWNVAANTAGLTSYIVPLSNFQDKGPAPVGQYQGMSSCGAYDMAGNVREWCWNKSEDNRFILGGGWNDQVYTYNDAYTQLPFDRTTTNGFRCMKHLETESRAAGLSEPIDFPKRDYRAEKPVSDDVFAIFKGMYTYDKTELNAQVISVDDSSEDWTREKISFDAAYGGERVMAYLFLPKKKGIPPFQTVVYFPGSGSIHQRSSENLTFSDTRNIDFIIKEGRAVLFPIYKSTYERGDALDSDYPEETTFYKDHVIMWVKDYMRSVDYLETREDIDVDKLAYYGYSWGGTMGAIIPAMEYRLKASVLHVAGFCFQKAFPEVDQINFVSRVKIPTLMLNGLYDHYFPMESSQKPFFELLGTPDEHKRQFIYDAGHFVPREQHIKETLDWLDRYLGPIK